VTVEEPGAPAEGEVKTPVTVPRPRLARRLLRALPVVAALVLLIWIFGHSGVLHKVERVVSDTQVRLNRAPTDSPVVVVDIDDDVIESFSEAPVRSIRCNWRNSSPTLRRASRP
jgi:CHASE2 domain-containing sensor protein